MDCTKNHVIGNALCVPHRHSQDAGRPTDFDLRVRINGQSCNRLGSSSKILPCSKIVSCRAFTVDMGVQLQSSELSFIIKVLDRKNCKTLPCAPDNTNHEKHKLTMIHLSPPYTKEFSASENLTQN